MSTGAIQEIARFFVMGLRDVFFGVYRYSSSKGPKPKDNAADKPSELQISHLSKLASIFVWVFFLNVVLFGCSDYLLNLIFLGLVRLGLYVTNLVVPSSSEYILKTYYPAFSAWFPFLWVFPLFAISRVTNLWWCQDIADITYTSRRRQASNLGITANISDLLYSTLLQLIFFLQIHILYVIPGVGGLSYLIGMPLLYSMYAFEYKWLNFGWQLPNRIAYIEGNWPYFLGFGSPLAVLILLTGSSVLSIGMCAFLFPLSIISANYSTPPKATHKYHLPAFNCAGYLTSKIFELLISWQESTRN